MTGSTGGMVVAATGSVDGAVVATGGTGDEMAAKTHSALILWIYLAAVVILYIGWRLAGRPGAAAGRTC